MVSFCLLILSVRSAKSGTISDRRALACSPPKKSSTCCTNVILKPGRMDWILCIAQSLRISDTGTDVSVRFLLVPMFLSFKHTCTSYWDCSLLILSTTQVWLLFRCVRLVQSILQFLVAYFKLELPFYSDWCGYYFWLFLALNVQVPRVCSTGILCRLFCANLFCRCANLICT
jgi:hypothetical protein